MGKTLRWFRVLLEGRKGSNSPEVVDVKQTKEKKKWGFVRSFREKTTMEKIKSEKRERVSLDPNKHSIAVAAATSAVAEAAVAAAQAAVEVVKMTAGSGRSTVAPSYSAGWKAELAAVKIQSAFRGYLARKALKALRGLVKLQALVRGHIVRKQTAETLKCMQSLLKAQARARASRTCHGNIFPAHPSHAQSPTTPEKYELNVRTSGAKHGKITGFERNSSKTGSIDLSYAERIRINSNWLQHCISGRDSLYQISPSKSLLVDDEKNAKILEIDNGKPFINSNHGDRICKHHSSPPLDYEYPPEFSFEVENLDNSPQFHSASSRLGSAKGGPFTPSKSDSNSMCTFFSGYSDYPNYMANTESSKAKVRSISAPKQRPEFEKSGSVKRGLTYDLRSKSSSLHAKFVSKAYPGSGRLDGMQMACFNGRD